VRLSQKKEGPAVNPAVNPDIKSRDQKVPSRGLEIRGREEQQLRLFLSRPPRSKSQLGFSGLDPFSRRKNSESQTWTPG
jgi:hypothetical protein